MKRAQYHRWGNNEVIQVEEVEIPTLKANEVLVKVEAAGVNPIDWKVREGLYADFLPNPFPLPMGWDFSGTIVDVKNEGSSFKKGDDVYGLIKFFEPAGCFAEYVAAPVEQIALKPTKINHQQAAGVPLVALTAWQALFETHQLQPHETVLIRAAAGSVGQMAIQLAKWQGATVIGVGSKAGQDIILSLGADTFIDYQSQDFTNEVKEVDLVLDLVGGDLSKSLKVIKPGGRLISFTQPISPEVEQAAQAKQITAQFTIVQPNGEQLAHMTKLIDKSILQTRVEKVYPLAQVKEALKLQESGHCHGKIILSPMRA